MILIKSCFLEHQFDVRSGNPDHHFGHPDDVKMITLGSPQK